MKMKNRVLALVLALAVLLGMAGCAAAGQEQGGYSGRVDGVKFDLPALGDAVSQHTQQQAQALADIRADEDFEKIFTHAQGVWEYSQPEPVKLSWTAEGKSPIEQYVVTLSTQADMSDAFYSQSTQEQSLEVCNLELGTTYYWTVGAVLEGKTVTSGPAHFTTAGDGPRNLDVPGVSNVRDVGGWRTADGGRVKQGMLYRCGRLNTSNIDTVKIEIKEDGISMLRDVLGVKTELDVRADEEAVYLSKSPLGGEVAYHRIPMLWDGNILQENPEPLRQIFALLAQEENYPMIIHCNIGTDRTGLICFLVNALLGVSEYDLCVDYVFSNFAAIKGSRSADTIREEYLPLINKAAGETLSERTYNYLLEQDVAQADLDAVIRIMKESA